MKSNAQLTPLKVTSERDFESEKPLHKFLQLVSKRGLPQTYEKMSLNTAVLEEASELAKIDPDRLSVKLVEWVETESLETILRLMAQSSITVDPAAIYTAAEKGRVEIFELIYRPELKPTLDIVLSIAVNNKNQPLIEKSLSLGANPVTGLVAEIKNSNLAGVRKYLALSPDLNDPRIHRALYHQLDSPVFAELRAVPERPLDLNKPCFSIQSCYMRQLEVTMLQYALLKGDMVKARRLISLTRPSVPKLEYWHMLFTTPEKMLFLLTRLDWQEVGAELLEYMENNATKEQIQVLIEAGYYRFD